MNQIFLETRMFWLSDGEEIMTLAFFILIQYQSVTDGQTDIPPLAIPAVCIACYAKALVKRLDLTNFWRSCVSLFIVVPCEAYSKHYQAMTSSVCTHIESAFSADDGPSVKWVTPSSQSESDARTSTPSTDE